MADIFVSYAKEDRSIVRRFVEELIKLGHDVFWDRDIPGGETYDSVIGRHLSEAKCVVVVWSKNSTLPNKEWIREEAHRAKENNILVPVLIDKISAPMGFGLRQAIDLSSWDGDKTSPSWGQLIERIVYVSAGKEILYKPPYQPLLLVRRLIRFAVMLLMVLGLCVLFSRYVPYDFLIKIRSIDDQINFKCPDKVEQALIDFSTHAPGYFDQAKAILALDDLRESAISGDARAASALGDIYSNRKPAAYLLERVKVPDTIISYPIPEDIGVVSASNTQSFIWYSVATIGATKDTFDSLSVAEQRSIRDAGWKLPRVTYYMKDEEFYPARNQVALVYERDGSAKALFNLGVLYQSNILVRKSNIQALKYYILASDRDVYSGREGAQAASYLKMIMTPAEIEKANELARLWEPPSPPSFSGQTPIAIDLEKDSENEE